MAEESVPRLEFMPEEPAAVPTQPSGAGGFPRLEYILEPVAAPPVGPEQRQEDMLRRARGVGEAAVGEAMRSVPGAVVGGIGSLETFAAKDVPTWIRNLYLTGKEKLDFVSPAEAERLRQAPPQWLPEQTPEQMSGVSSPIMHYPTYKGVSEGLKKFSGELGLPIMGREPKTPEEKVAAEAVKGTAFGLPGAARGILGRALAGAAAGAAGEVAGQITEGQPNEGYWRLVSALGGGLAGAKAANALVPSIRGKDDLSRALSEDIAQGQLKMSPEQIRQAIAEGREITPMDVAGPNTLAYIQKSAGTSNLNISRAQQFNSMLQERAAESGSRIRNDAEGAFQRPLDADAFKKTLEAAGSQTRGQVFELARKNPNASAIPPALTASLEARPAVQEAMKRANVSAENLSQFDIRPPVTTPAVPGAPSRWVQTPQGLREQPEIPAVPAQTTPGNLNYWHQVDRKLGDMIREAQRTGKNTEASEYIQTQNDLRKRLYSVVPEYETALSVSRKTFQGESAPEAGFNFAQTLFTAKKNPFVRGDVRRDFASMPPENQEALAHGVAHFVVQKAESGQIKQLANKFREDKNFQRDMQVVLGPERYNQIAGSVLTEDVLRKMPPVQPSTGGVSAGTVGLTAGLGTVALENLPFLLSQPQITQPMAIRALTAAALGAGAKSIYQYGEKRVADVIIPMMLSRDPAQLAQLAKLTEESAVVRKLFNRMNTTLEVAYNQAQNRALSEERPARATGGAVNLKALANAARKAVTQSTEDLLKTPDEHVVKALEVANRHI